MYFSLKERQIQRFEFLENIKKNTIWTLSYLTNPVASYKTYTKTTLNYS